MKKLIFALALLLFCSCSATKPKEQEEASIPTDNPNIIIYDEEEDEEESPEERATVDKSIQLNDVLFDLINKQYDELLNVKGKLSLSDSNADEFDNKQGEQPFPFIIRDTLQHPKVDGRFTLHFLSGDSITFNDIPEKYGDALTTYSYIGFLNNIKKYIVSVMFWEYYICLLIDQSNGTISTFNGTPLFNKQGTAMLIQDADPYEDSTVYYIYQLQHKTLNPTHRLVTDLHYPENYYWKNDSTLNIKATTPVNEDTVYYKLNISQDKLYK